ncbi:NAD(P)H-dependent oxidoreductase [Candidatus Berkelbacteria bacterium]|nr:NAD(P)H-dependent oxidoreductase [Candidatus Berkelbacteria bacterium]
MSSSLYIPVILGTIRPGRLSERVARLIYTELTKLSNIQTELIDIRALDFDFKNEGPSARMPKFSRQMWQMHGLIIVAPEYNHSYPGSLKMIMDTNLAEYRDKAVGLVGVSDGPWGGARLVENLINYTQTLGLKPLRTALYFPQAEKIIDPEGQLVNPNYLPRINRFFQDLILLAQTLAPIQKHASKIEAL